MRRVTPPAVTLLDVARAAGVSKSTASDALQGSGRVAEATWDRVRGIAEELGYRPNSAACCCAAPAPEPSACTCRRPLPGWTTT